MSRALRFLAGPEAMDRIRREGLREEMFDVVAGASGGPKWLALTRMDRVLFSRWFRQRTRPLHMVGSSIGTWRFTYAAQRDPAAAARRFEEAYLDYTVEGTITPARISDDSRRFLELIMAEGGAEAALSHPCMRLSVLAVRGRHLAGHRHPAFMGIGMVAAALANAVSRRTLPLFFERVLVHDQRSEPPFDCRQGFPTRPVPLTPANLPTALLASGAVPFLFEVVREMDGAAPGAYMDGGIMDYHLDIPFKGEGLVLYPHFYDRIVPGWFDKGLKWRRPNPANLSRTLLFCPSPEFVAKLPYGKIPDRADFKKIPTAERQRYWRAVVAETDRLADELAEALERGDIGDRLEPLRG
ncbi:MAG TPA: patatin-like phospholipase family protein [Azospirillaceae bacterium]|nr:patatin-like phospholipase family protein [Azospirillaceae bacterium]